MQGQGSDGLIQPLSLCYQLCLDGLVSGQSLLQRCHDRHIILQQTDLHFELLHLLYRFIQLPFQLPVLPDNLLRPINFPLHLHKPTLQILVIHQSAFELILHLIPLHAKTDNFFLITCHFFLGDLTHRTDFGLKNTQIIFVLINLMHFGVDYTVQPLYFRP